MHTHITINTFTMIRVILTLISVGIICTIIPPHHTYAQSHNIHPIITEIAHIGTKNTQTNCKKIPTSRFTCAMDKWIELYNPTPQPIDLTEYSLSFGAHKKRDFYRTVHLNGVLKPHTFYILTNKNKHLHSQLPEELIKQEIGFLQVLSKKEAEFSSRIHVSLQHIKGGYNQLVSQVFFCDTVSTIEITVNSGSCSNTQWSEMNASPGKLSPEQVLIYDQKSTEKDLSVAIDSEHNTQSQTSIIDIKDNINSSMQTTNVTPIEKENERVETNTQDTIAIEAVSFIDADRIEIGSKDLFIPKVANTYQHSIKKPVSDPQTLIPITHDIQKTQKRVEMQVHVQQKNLLLNARNHETIDLAVENNPGAYVHSFKQIPTQGLYPLKQANQPLSFTVGAQHIITTHKNIHTNLIPAVWKIILIALYISPIVLGYKIYRNYLPKYSLCTTVC